MAHFAVVGNFDAEFELLEPETVRSPRRRALCRKLCESLREELREDGFDAIVLEPESGAASGSELRGLRGLCWMPTPKGLAVARAARLSVGEAPPVDVLRRANGRDLAHRLSAELDKEFVTEFCASFDHALAVVRELLACGPVLCKRMLGFSGRMRKELNEGFVSETEEAWIRGSFDGLAPGLVVEPLCDVDAEWSCHGVLTAEGELIRRGVVAFDTGSRGAFAAARADQQVSSEIVEQLEVAQCEVADGLREVGYFGPFAFDAFAYRVSSGGPRLRRLSDLNARLTRTTFAPNLLRFDPELLS
ncbi:MAG: hypothetical protein AAF196_00060 [Planctomycetota bacterium]